MKLGIKKKNSLKSLSNTTIDPVNLGNLLQNLKKQKIDNVIMEASSHGLKQHRLDGLMFNVGIFSNLSHDHLDYHKNFKDYLDSKLHLFRNLVKKNGNVITDQSIPQFNIIKNISKKKKLKLNFLPPDKGHRQRRWKSPYALGHAPTLVHPSYRPCRSAAARHLCQ